MSQIRDSLHPDGPGVVYLLHLDRPFGHARHYLGWSRNLDRRLAHHWRGTGATMLRHAREAGIGWTVARTWAGTRTLESQLKKRGGRARLCPVCIAAKVTVCASVAQPV